MTDERSATPEMTDINIVASADPTGEAMMGSSIPSLDPPPMVEPGGAQKREGLAPEIWVVGLIAVIVILLLLFGVALG